MLAKKEERKSPYEATKSLNVKYKFKYYKFEDASVKVPGAESHAILYSACHDMLEMRKTLAHKSGKLIYADDSAWEKCNFATANLTFLYTDTTLEEGYLGEDIEQRTFSFNASDPLSRILSCADMYTEPYQAKGVYSSKAGRDEKFCKLLADRVRGFSPLAPYYAYRPDATICDEAGLTEAIEGPMFHETYHHTEQAIMHAMSSATGLKAITETLLKLDAAYVYGIVLDIYTQRSMCCNCNACLLGMQASHSEGFLADLSKSLERASIQPRIGKNLMLSTRVSASKASRDGASLEALKLPMDKKVVHTYNPDLDCKVFQAENRALGTKHIVKEWGEEVPRYTGTYFSSSQIASKTHLEKALALP